MEELLELVNSQPDNVNARIELAKKYLTNHDYENAKPILEEVIRIDPNHLDGNYILGQLYEFDEEFSNAVKCYERIIQQQPTFDFVYKLGQLYEGADEYEKALDMFANCYQHAPEDNNLCERIAHVSRILGNRTQAIEFYKRLLLIDPNDIVALTQLMELYEEEGNNFLYYVTKARINEEEGALSQAISSYKKAVPEASNKEDALRLRLTVVRLLFQKENYNQAIDELLHIIEQDDKNFYAYTSLAEAYLKLDNQEAACDAYEKAHSINPEDKNIISELADLYTELEEPQKALELIEKLVKIEPDNLSHYVNLAKSYIALNNDSKAEELLNFVLEKDPKNVEAIGVLADYYSLKKDYENALKNAEKIKELIPKSPFGYRKAAEIQEINGNRFESHYNFGVYHDLKGEKQLAIDEFNWALEHNPRNLEITLKLAKLYEEISEEFIAIEFYQRAYKLDKENLTALQKMGEILTKQKEYHQAVDVYTQILKLHENNKEAYFNLAEAYEHTKNYELALNSYKKYIEISNLSGRADEAKSRIEKIESKINGEDDEGLLNKIFKLFSK